MAAWLNDNQLWSRAASRVERSWAKFSFDRVAAKLLNTEPLPIQGDSPLFLSLICHRDIISYLAAIKSLYVQFGRGRVLVVDDGSLTARDQGILSYHIPGVKFVDLKTIQTGPAPRADFFWERLVKIIQLTSDNYVIQLDADTLVSDSIPEVVQCWKDNKSFLLGTDAGKSISTALDAARMVQGWIKKYGWTNVPAGTEAEASLDRLPEAADRSYVHASAGFAGFARGAFCIADLEWFSTEMSQMLGVQRWMEYGTEQIASNYILANSPGAVVLPFPRYACFEPHLERGDHAFLHFIGSYRYNDGVYLRRVAEFIARYKKLNIRNESQTAA